MPTVHKRVMLNVPQDTLEKLEKISKVEKRSMAMTCLMLIETGLKDPKFKEILESAQKEMPEYGKDFKSYMDLIPEDKRSDKAKDPITPEKLKEALALLEMMEKLKS